MTVMWRTGETHEPRAGSSIYAYVYIPGVGFKGFVCIFFFFFFLKSTVCRGFFFFLLDPQMT